MKKLYLKIHNVLFAIIKLESTMPNLYDIHKLTCGILKLSRKMKNTLKYINI